LGSRAKAEEKLPPRRINDLDSGEVVGNHGFWGAGKRLRNPGVSHSRAVIAWIRVISGWLILHSHGRSWTRGVRLQLPVYSRYSCRVIHS
jgi:hypothetical protein